MTWSSAKFHRVHCDYNTDWRGRLPVFRVTRVCAPRSVVGSLRSSDVILSIQGEGLPEEVSRAWVLARVRATTKARKYGETCVGPVGKRSLRNSNEITSSPVFQLAPPSFVAPMSRYRRAGRSHPRWDLRVPTACLKQKVSDEFGPVDLTQVEHIEFSMIEREQGVLGFDDVAFTD